MDLSLRGIIVPAATPFTPQEEIDFQGISYNCARWRATDICGVMCLGSNGEFRSLSDDESLDVIKIFSERLTDKTLIAGVGRESLYHTLEFIERVEQSGASVDYYSVLTPGYFSSSMTDNALHGYFTAIADHSPRPILLYVAPKFANGVKISPQLLKDLADHPNIAGLKDTSDDMMDAYLDAVSGRDDFTILAGSIATLLKCLSRGGAGGVVSAANYFPEACSSVTSHFFSGNIAQAQAEYDILRTLIGSTGGKYSTPGLKACMNLLGYQAGIPRRPLLPLDHTIVKELRNQLESKGFSVR